MATVRPAACSNQVNADSNPKHIACLTSCACCAVVSLCVIVWTVVSSCCKWHVALHWHRSRQRRQRHIQQRTCQHAMIKMPSAPAVLSRGTGPHGQVVEQAGFVAALLRPIRSHQLQACWTGLLACTCNHIYFDCVTACPARDIEHAQHAVLPNMTTSRKRTTRQDTPEQLLVTSCWHTCNSLSATWHVRDPIALKAGCKPGTTSSGHMFGRYTPAWPLGLS
jgi:hypothetical protein